MGGYGLLVGLFYLFGGDFSFGGLVVKAVGYNPRGLNRCIEL